jgi:dGTPase
LQLLETLFHFYLKHPKEIGGQSHRRIPKAGLHRAVCDYLAGMTDRYVRLEYERLFGANPDLD